MLNILSQENHDDLNCFKPQRIHCCPCFFKDLVLTKNIGITCHQQLISFVYVNVNCECNAIFTVKKDNLCLIVCHLHAGLQLEYLEVKFDCFHYQKTAFFNVKIEDKK